MKHLNKYSCMSAKISPEVPDFQMQVVSVDCFHCGRVTRFPVPSTYVDWELVANDYKRAAERMMRGMDQMITDIDVMGTATNPVREYMANQWKMLLLEAKKHFDG